MGRTGRRIALLVTAAAVALAGCTSNTKQGTGTARPGASTGSSAAPSGTPSGASGSTAPDTPASGAAAGAPHRCHTADLTGRVEGHDEGAGQRYAALALTNHTGSACTVYGYPGLQLVDAHGTPLRTTVRRDSPPGPRLLTVQPGRTVWTELHWTVVAADDEAATHCAPDPTVLRVIPPDETTQLSMPFAYGPVCQHGDVSVQPFGPDRPPIQP